MRANNYHLPAAHRSLRRYVGDAVPEVVVTPEVDMSSLYALDSGNTGSWSTQDWTNALNSLGALATIGVKTYATVEQIQHGNSAPYAIATGTATGTLPVAAAPGFSINSLFDFATPYPYLLGAGVAFVLMRK